MDSFRSVVTIDLRLSFKPFSEGFSKDYLASSLSSLISAKVSIKSDSFKFNR